MAPTFDLQLIFRADSNIQAEMIIAALKNASIPSFKQDLGNAGIMNIYGGNSKAGENIYVSGENAERAIEVLEGMGLINYTEQEE